MSSALEKIFANDPTLFLRDGSSLCAEWEEACTHFEEELQAHHPDLVEDFVALWREESARRQKLYAHIFACGAKWGAQLSKEMEDKTY